MNTPTQTLFLYLQSEGLFNDWEDSQGNAHPAPFVQTRFFDEKAKGIGSNTRIFFFKSLGGSANRYISDPAFSFSMVGFANDNDAILEDYANLVYASLSNFTTADCIIGIDPISPVSGAYPMASGRHHYDMEFTVTVDSGVLA
jgi:hypothetical protein